MADVHSGIRSDSNFLNLKQIDQNSIRREIFDFLVKGENIVDCFQTVRDQVIFTDKRIIVVNVQGITGKKVSYYFYPYSKVQTFGIETAGLLDIDSEMVLTFANGIVLQFDFRSHVDIRGICANIQRYILE